MSQWAEKLIKPLLCAGLFFAGNLCAEAKEKIAMLSFGDLIDTAVKESHPGVGEGFSPSREFNSKAAIEKSFERLRKEGFTTIYWRMLWDGHPVSGAYLFYSSQMQREITLLRNEFENTPYCWDPHEIRWPIEVAHKLGMKLYAYVDIYNEGAPPGAYHEYGVDPFPIHYPWGLVYEAEFPWQSKFVHGHPEYQLLDRTGKRYHYGVLEWAYPEAREYWEKDIKILLDKYDVDGIHLDTRTEGPGPEYADQYGFNEPIVKEYQRRYGVNILEEDFDLEKWRALRGEYLTLLFKEISEAVHAKSKKFSVGTVQGDYIGYPLGNMKLEWRRWISERMIDELNLNEQGWGWNNQGKQGYGYMTDHATGRGLKPQDAAIREDYGPLCKKYGTKLYFYCRPGGPRPVSEPCCEGRATPAAIKRPPNWCEVMSSMPEFDGVIYIVF